MLIVVATCPRKDRVDRAYLRSTVAQVDAEGGAPFERLIMADGALDLDLVPDGWSWRYTVAAGERGGATRTMHAALVEANARGLDLLYFEDDVEMCRGAVSEMVRAAAAIPQDAAFMTFFDAVEYPNAEPGVYVTPPLGNHSHGLWGSQACYFPCHTVRRLLREDWQSTPWGAHSNACDVIMSCLVSRWHLGWAVYVPSLVQHIGTSSACGNGDGPLHSSRVSTTYPGRDFDPEESRREARKLAAFHWLLDHPEFVPGPKKGTE